MNKWTRLQDKIASSRLLIVVLLLMFSCIFLIFFLRAETNFRIYFKYITQGVVTDFKTIQQDGIANHHLQYAELSGWMRYDVPLDFVTENNHVISRLILLEDPVTQYVIIVETQSVYGFGEEEYTNISGIIRKMDDESYEIIDRDVGPAFDEMKANGWNIDPHYYINENEIIPKRMAGGIFLFGIVNILLILVCLALLLVPHPKTIKDMSKYERKLHDS